MYFGSPSWRVVRSGYVANVVCVHGVKTDEIYSVDGQYPCRPPAFEGRLTPKHWEGSLSKGVHDRCAAKSFGHVQADRAINGSRWFAVPVLAQGLRFELLLARGAGCG